MKKITKTMALALAFAMLLLSVPVLALGEKQVRSERDFILNENDLAKAIAFLEIEDENGVKNGAKINPNYTPEDPETWQNHNEWGAYGFLFYLVDQQDDDFYVRLVEVNLPEGCNFVGNLDLSDCSALTKVIYSIDYSGENEYGLDAIDVHGCTSLERLILWGNMKITEVDVTDCPELNDLDCTYTSISRINLSNNRKLGFADFGSCFRLEELDLSNNTLLWGLNCTFCPLTELDLSNNPELEELDLSCNFISSLDLSNNPNLRTLICDNLRITELDVSACTNIYSVCCHDCDIREFDFSENAQLLLDGVRAEGAGFVGCYAWHSQNDSTVYAYPEEGETFEGWYNVEGELLSKELYYDTRGEHGTVLIARFSGGSEPTPGDVDGNGEVAVSDAVLALRAAMGIHELSAEQTAAADMDENGSIEVSDAIIILRVAMGLLG